MSWSSTFKTTIPLGNCPIVPLSISNISVSRTSAVAGKVPYLVTFMAFLSTRAIVMKMELGVLLMAMVVSGGIISLLFVVSLPFRIGDALTWWNGQIRTLSPDAYTMTWEILKKRMTDKYCPQGEIKKLEIDLWNLNVKGNDVP
nr:hypothetical protein [Tanacetum cinerariifolium]